MSAKKVISKQPWINDENMVVGEVTFYGDGTSIEEFYDHIGPIEGPNHMFRSENFSLLEENGFQLVYDNLSKNAGELEFMFFNKEKGLFFQQCCTIKNQLYSKAVIFCELKRIIPDIYMEKWII